jgi:hypothetical protein
MKVQMDEQPVAVARAALSRSSIRELRHLTVRADGDGVALYGGVGSFYHKQLTQALVRNELDGVQNVNVNHVTVH